MLVGISALVAFGTKRDPARFAIAVVLLLIVGVFAPSGAWGNVLHSERTFFGVYRVSLDDERRFISLYHGTTLHGQQVLGDRNPEPKTYYYPRSPIGQVFASRASQPNLAVGVVGLGVGSLAAYAKPHEKWTFYEIDPAVERIARDDQYFTISGSLRRRVSRGSGRCAGIPGKGRAAVRHTGARRIQLGCDSNPSHYQRSDSHVSGSSTTGWCDRAAYFRIVMSHFGPCLRAWRATTALWRLELGAVTRNR